MTLAELQTKVRDNPTLETRTQIVQAIRAATDEQEKRALRWLIEGLDVILFNAMETEYGSTSGPSQP